MLTQGLFLTFSMKESVFLFYRNDEGRYLSCLRSDTQDYGLVGGCVDPHETLEEALVREVKEEANLTLNKDYLKRFYTNLELKDNSCVSVFIYQGVIDFSTLRNSDEGLIVFCSEQELINSTYGEFNKKLINLL